MAKKLLQTRHRKSSGSEGDWQDEGIFSFNNHDELSSKGHKFLQSINRDNYEIRWVPVNTKKIDEAVSLNVSTEQDGMTSNTTFTAEDTADLVSLLKNAGIKSHMFNGPATLTVDIQDPTGSVYSTIQSPDLRSIMQLLEPEFEDLGNMEDSLAAQDMEAELETPADIQDKIDQEQEAELSAPVSPVEEPIVREAIDDAAFDMSDGLKPGDDKVIIDDYGDQVIIFVCKTVNLEDGSFEEAQDELEKKALEVAKENGLIVSVGADMGDDGRMYGQHLARGFNDETGEFVGDEEAYGTVLAWCAWVSEEPELEETADFDYRESERGPKEYHQRADKKIIQPDTRRVPARSSDNPLQESADTSFTTYIELNDEELEVEVYFDYDSGDFDTGLDYPKTASFGESITIGSVMYQGQDIISQLDQYTINRLEEAAMEHLAQQHSLRTDREYDESIDSEENHSGLRSYLTKVEAKKSLRDVKMVGEEDLIGEYRSHDDYARKSKQFGKPMYLNTDCGYASFNDLGDHEYFDMATGGVTVVSINRNGKWGLNYVSGHGGSHFKPGEAVTIVTQTSSGNKFREGKVVDTFTGEEYIKNKDEVAARLALHGIKPDRKLSVKTFD